MPKQTPTQERIAELVRKADHATRDLMMYGVNGKAAPAEVYRIAQEYGQLFERLLNLHAILKEKAKEGKPSNVADYVSPHRETLDRIAGDGPSA